MSSAFRALRVISAALGLAVMMGGCASDSGYGGYGGADVTVVGYGGYYGDYYGGYYPGYYPGGSCCWYGDDGRPIEVPPPGNRPDRPTTLPAHPEQLPAQRPSQPTTRPAPQPSTGASRPSTRPSTGMSSRPAPRPTPRPMGGGGRRR